MTLMTGKISLKLISITVSILLILCVLSVFILVHPSCFAYKCLSFPGVASWKEKTVYESSKNAWRGLLSAPDYLIKLEADNSITPQNAAMFTKTKMMDIDGLFADARSPYPGAISDKITCEDKYKPVIKQLTSKNGIPVTYFKEYLNDRFQYGICVDDQITYTGYAAIFYCAQTSQWYQMELIVDKQTNKPDRTYTDQFREIGCQRPSVKTGKLFP